MFKNIFRLTVVGYVWQRYKTLIVSLLLLILYLWIVGEIHADYVSYSELNEDRHFIGISFVIKWIAYLCGALVFVFINSLLPIKKTQIKDKVSGKKEKSADNVSSDPFATIRNRNQLRSKADFLIEKNKNINKSN